MRRLLAIAATEVKQVLRDRPSLALLLLLPALQILLFGFAIRTEPRDMPIGLAGRGERIDAIAQTIASDPRLMLARRATATDPERMLRDGAVIAISLAPSGAIRIDADGADPMAAKAALTILQDRMLRSAARAFPLTIPEIALRWRFNPDQQPAWVLIPALGGVIVMITMLMLAAQSVVRERDDGSWEALLLSRANGFEILVGKLLPYLVIAVLQEALMLAIGVALFGLPPRAGSLALLAITIPFSTAYLAWGFVLSLVARSRLQAVQGAMFFYLPSMLLSGFLFPFAAMPGWARAIGEALPLTHFVRASRNLVLRGSADWIEGLPMVLFAGAGLAIAWLIWRRETLG